MEEISNTNIEELVTVTYLCVDTSHQKAISSSRYWNLVIIIPPAHCNHCSMSQAFDFLPVRSKICHLPVTICFYCFLSPLPCLLIFYVPLSWSFKLNDCVRSLTGQVLGRNDNLFREQFPKASD